MSEVKGDVLKLKKRGEDGNRVITVRIKEETLSEIDRIAKEVNYSRNELIYTILEHGVRTIENRIRKRPSRHPEGLLSFHISFSLGRLKLGLSFHY